MTPECREVHEETDYALFKVSGLALALLDLALEHPILSNSDNNGVMAVINCLRD